MNVTQVLTECQDNSNKIQGLLYAYRLLMNNEQALDGRIAILDRVSDLACLSDELISDQLTKYL